MAASRLVYMYLGSCICRSHLQHVSCTNDHEMYPTLASRIQACIHNNCLEASPESPSQVDIGNSIRIREESRRVDALKSYIAQLRQYNIHHLKRVVQGNTIERA